MDAINCFHNCWLSKLLNTEKFRRSRTRFVRWQVQVPLHATFSQIKLCDRLNFLNINTPLTTDNSSLKKPTILRFHSWKERKKYADHICGLWSCSISFVYPDLPTVNYMYKHTDFARNHLSVVVRAVPTLLLSCKGKREHNVPYLCPIDARGLGFRKRRLWQ